MTNTNLQHMVDELGAGVLTRDAVYIHRTFEMAQLTPTQQAEYMAEKTALVGADRVDSSYLIPLQHAINKLHKRNKLSFIMEPVVFSSVAEPSGPLYNFGKDRYNHLQQAYEKIPYIDQVGFRRPGDPYYSVIVSIERRIKVGEDAFVYYVTHMAGRRSEVKTRSPRPITDKYAKVTSVFRSAAAAIRCVASAQPVSTYVAASTVAYNSDYVVRNLNGYFKEEFEKLRNETGRKLTNSKLQLPLLDVLVALMRGETVSELPHPNLRKAMEEYRDSERELVEQQRDSLLSEHVLMVTSFGDDTHGCAFYTNKRNEFYMRRIESLGCLPEAVVGRLQTVAINKAAGTIPGVGMVVPHCSHTLLRSGTDCIAVLVTEDELKSVFEGQL
jgi:hypothetical protein